MIFELANNHMGDVEHGLAIIDSYGNLAKSYPFEFAFKFQFRDISTFIHPDYKDRLDIKYVKRFSETTLTSKEFELMAERIRELDMLVVTTPFDEKSVKFAVQLDVDIMKVASCSFTDWPLLETIAGCKKPLIASTAGAALQDIDRVVSFFQHREKELAVMHCVGEYPTSSTNLQLNQIQLLRKRYPTVPIGFSTHEQPNNYESVLVAFGQGARIFEKHVAVESNDYSKNDYSVTPAQAKQWLDSALRAYEMMGVQDERHPISEKEKGDLRQFQRGVFVNNQITEGSQLSDDDVFFAFPNVEGQLLANDWSKYHRHVLNRSLASRSPVMIEDVDIVDKRSKVYQICKEVRGLFQKAGVVYPGGVELEISHHYGIEYFEKTGITMITVVNRDYCKKLIAVLPGQKHPEQYHKIKEETFHLLYGDIQLTLDGQVVEMGCGDTVTIEPGVRHKFQSNGGCVIEEISTTHQFSDSFYTDQTIMDNHDRKTILKYWLD